MPLRPHAEAKLLQGVTTDVTGNCGFSPFPLDDSLEGSARHGIFFEPELKERWSALADFTSALLDVCPAINVAPLVGLGAIRLSVMGEDRSAPTDDELARMRRLLAEQLKQGAFGASTGLIYPPGSYAEPAELWALAEVIAEFGGLYATHIRNEAHEVEAAVDEALELGARAGCAVQISHHKVFGENNWGKVDSTLNRIEQVNRGAGDVSFDVYPYNAGSTSLAALLGPDALDGGEGPLRQRLVDPSERAKIATLVEERAFVSLEHVLIAAVPSEPDLAGRMLVDVAAERGLAASELLLQLVEVDGRDALMVVFGMSERDVRHVLVHPLSIVASDGWTMAIDACSYAHPRNFGYSARLLGHYVRDEKLMPLERAIAKLSAMPAERLGLVDRGRLQEGAAADIVIFDLDEVNEHGTFGDPCHHPSGFSFVLVGGQLAVDDGLPTGYRAGKVLLKHV